MTLESGLGQVRQYKWLQGFTLLVVSWDSFIARIGRKEPNGLNLHKALKHPLWVRRVLVGLKWVWTLRGPVSLYCRPLCQCRTETVCRDGPVKCTVRQKELILQRRASRNSWTRLYQMISRYITFRGLVEGAHSPESTWRCWRKRGHSKAAYIHCQVP